MGSPCLACGSERHTVRMTTSRFDVRQCGDCRLVYRGPFDGDETILYDYYEERLGLDRGDLFGDLTSSRYRDLLGQLGESLPGRRLLDVGCGQGQLIDAAVQAGWDATGIDSSDSAIRVARSLNLPCENADFRELPAGQGFDLVTVIEVIEHVDDPQDLLNRCAELLAPGGRIYLTTPNFASLGRRVLGAGWPAIHEEHRTYLTPRTLRAMAARAGLVGTIATRNLSTDVLRRLTRRPAVEATGDQELRHRVEASPALRVAKQAVNVALRASGLGETIVATLHR